MARLHRIKSWPDSFRAIVSGEKPFDVRRFDRDYKVGDYVQIHQFDPTNDVFMGESVYRRISHMELVGERLTFVVLGYEPKAPSNPEAEGPIEIVGPERKPTNVG